MNESMNRRWAAVRAAAAFWILGWFWKAAFYFIYLFRVVPAYPVDADHFPRFFLQGQWAQVFYCLPAAGMAILMTRSTGVLRSCAFLMLVSAVVMNLHLATYNDATFVAAFWSALWLMWLAVNFQQPEEPLRKEGTGLAKAVFALIFLGGLVGKLTPEYWRGEVIERLFFVQASSPLAALAGHLSEIKRTALAAGISRAIIVAEFILALSIVLPLRAVLVLAVCSGMGLCLFSTGKILSVFLPLVGPLVACRIWQGFRAARG